MYLVTGDALTYVFKIYRPGWRDAPAVLWEIDLLAHLSKQGAPVANAIPRSDGRAITAIEAAEGDRYGVLFEYAEGVKPRPPFSADLYHRFGRAAGLIHKWSDSFVSPYRRRPLDLSVLIDEPLDAIQPFLTHRPEDSAYVLGLSKKLRSGISDLDEAGLDWGVCHHDMSLDNVHLTPAGGVIFYDFDSGGPGWRSLDFQGVYHNAVYNQNDHWDAFVRGYTEIQQRRSYRHSVFCPYLRPLGHACGHNPVPLGRRIVSQR